MKDKIDTVNKAIKAYPLVEFDGRVVSAVGFHGEGVYIDYRDNSYIVSYIVVSVAEFMLAEFTYYKEHGSVK